MDTALEQRLVRIEERLDALEAFSAARQGRTTFVAPVPTPAPVAEVRPPTAPVPSTPRRARPAVPAPPVAREASRADVEREPTPAATRPPTTTTTAPDRRPRDLERFVGIAVLGRIGVGAVLLAAGYFAQMAYRQASELGRLAILYTAGASLLATGWALRPRVSERFVGLLWGGGAAILWLAAVAAHVRYHLVGQEVGLLLAVGACAVATVHARVLRHAWLASVALAGAFAAPLLLMPDGDPRTFFTLYGLLLHAWAVLCERRFAWRAPRLVAVVGVIALTIAWAAPHGRWDLSTWLHLQAAILGLTLYELVQLARRADIEEEWANGATTVTAIFQLLLLVPFFVNVAWSTPSPLRWSVTLVGAGYFTLSTWLTPGATGGARRLARGLGHLGALLLPFGVVGWILDSVVAADLRSLVHAGALAVVAGGLMAFQRRSGTGPIGAVVAAVLAMLLVVPGLDGSALRLGALALAFVPALALGLRATRPAWVTLGETLTLLLAVLGAAALGGRSAPATPVGFALGAAAALLLTWRRAPGSGLADSIAAPAIVPCLALAWLALVTAGPLKALGPALLGTGTLTALVVAAAAILMALVRAPLDRSATSGHRTVAGATAALVLLIAGHREASSFATLHAGAARGLALVGYYVLAIAGLVGLCRRARPPWLVPLSGALLVIAALHAFLLPGADPQAAHILPGYLLVALLPYGLSRALGPTPALIPWRGAALSLLAGAWVAHAALGRLPHDLALVNVRMAAGLITLAGLLAATRLRTASGDRRLALVLGALALPVAYGIGLGEVLDRVRGAEGAWPSVAVSLYTTAYAGALLALGFLRQAHQLRYLALGMFGVVILKVGFYDLRATDLPLRVLVTGVLGLVLLAAAYAYARRRSDDAPPPTAPAPAPVPDPAREPTTPPDDAEAAA